MPGNDEPRSVEQRVGDHDSVLSKLDRKAEDILAELRELRAALDIRPTRVEQTFLRRLSVVALLLTILMAIFIHDSHNAKCSDGARAKDGIDYVAHADRSTYSSDRLQELLRKPLPDSCDIAFPIHAHNSEDDWPTPYNLMGIAIYLLLMGGAALWTRWPVWTVRTENHGDPGSGPPPPWPGQDTDK